MNPHAINGERLLRQGRANEAVSAFRSALAVEPGDGRMHALLALALHGAKDAAGSLAAAREGVRLAPGDAFAHYVMGMSFLWAGKLLDAERAGKAALRIDPAASHHYHLLALVAAEQHQYPAALGLAEQGLGLDPEDTDLLNLRGQLLIQLRRTGEAADAARQAIGADPHDAHSHANAGWAALHNNDPRQALTHFKESLRLDPGNDWAKQGLAEAMKARNPLYRVLLGFFLWMARLDSRVQTALIIAGVLVARMLFATVREFPETGPVVWTLLGVYFLFVLLTWVAVPLFNLTLLLSPYGRNALTPGSRVASVCFGALALSGLLLLGLGVWAGPTPLVYWGVLSLVGAVFVPQVPMQERLDRRWVMGVGCGVVGLAGAVCIVGKTTLEDGHPVTVLAGAAAVLGVLALMWLPLLMGLVRRGG